MGEAIGSAIGDFFDTPIVAIAARFLAVAIVIVWLAVAYWAFVDMRRRTAHPAVAYAAAALVILASPVAFPLALVIHWIVRPDFQIADRRLERLRARLLEHDAARMLCPDCKLAVEEDWLLCPRCRRSLTHHCQRCSGTVQLDWSVCAWCGTELDGSELQRLEAPA